MVLSVSTQLILAAFVGIGIFLSIAAFAIPKSLTRQMTVTEDGALRTGTLGDVNIIVSLLSDVGEVFERDRGEDLVERLRKTGWIYKSPEEYYARRVYLALIMLAIAILAGLVINLSFMMIAGLATAAVFFGYTSPTRAVKKTIAKRRDQIRNEMGFGLEQIVNLLNAGVNLPQAMNHVRDFGLFGQVCERVSKEMSTQKTIDEVVEDAIKGVPAPNELREFMELVKLSQTGGEIQIQAIKVMAKMLRARLGNEIVERGGKAKIKATLVNVLIIVTASLIAIGVPGVILFSSNHGGF